MTIWFTADTHFGHKRIIELCKRPFASVEEMDEYMINQWNDCVLKGDTVYHLGDFAFCDHTPYLQRLNGQKHLIRGNHDHRNRINKAVGWASVNDMLKVKVDGQSIVLCHYAMRVWRNSHYGALHFYGHSHGNLHGDSQSCDVGVDCWGFAPVDLSMIQRLLAWSDKRREPDHHLPVLEAKDAVSQMSVKQVSVCEESPEDTAAGGLQVHPMW